MAKEFQMSVPNFCKKKAQGARMRPPKIDREGAFEIARQLRAIGNNVNQLSERANEIGRDLAKEVAKGHECVVYTHTDKDHIHNHIVINSVNYENGLKYNASKEELYRIREINDRLCKERDLSVVKEYSSPTRY